MGAITTAEYPLSSAISAAAAATSVLPEPTSPWSSRRMGTVPPMSSRISRNTRFWA